MNNPIATGHSTLHHLERTTLAFLLMLFLQPLLFAASPADRFWQGHIAYKQKQYEKCAAMYERSIEAGQKDPDVFYNAAGCYALLGKPDQAFGKLDQLCAGPFWDLAGLQAESDFASLHKDPRWQKAVATCKTAEEKYLVGANKHLYELFLSARTYPATAMTNKESVVAIVSKKELKTSADYFQAAYILVLTVDSQSLKLAGSLAKKVFEMTPPHPQAKGFFAVATDRYLWSIHAPQIYGTQMVQDKAGKWTSEPMNPQGVTDEERQAMNVLSVEFVRERIRLANQGIE